MKEATNQDRLNELFDEDPRSDTSIAADLGVSKQTVSAWRTGTRSPKKDMLVRIAEKYNVTIEWLMGFDVDKHGTRQLPVVVPDSKLWLEITRHMTPDDYYMVMNAFDRTLQMMKEKGLIDK